MTEYIHCDNCGTAVAHGSKKVWAYGSMRYCRGKCLVAAFQKNEVEPTQPKENESWTVLREKYLEEERLKVEFSKSNRSLDT